MPGSTRAFVLAALLLRVGAAPCATSAQPLLRNPRSIIAADAIVGGYVAFPDICRARNGDLLVVFYSGYAHVSPPNGKWPDGGRVMLSRSTDNGATWSAPVVLADTPGDDRDPSIACLTDGTLICSWFTAFDAARRPAGETRPVGIYTARSNDGGKHWSAPSLMGVPGATWWACSSPIRELPDHTLILGLYTEGTEPGSVYGATVRSRDNGKTWTDLATIGKGAGLYLDAETDVVRLKDGSLLAALRSSVTDLYFARSTDGGKTWGKVWDSGFKGHCPYFLRTRGGMVLLAHRLPDTAIHWSTDEGKTWQGPFVVDRRGGAYPSMVELPDGAVLCVYYDDGSSIWACRLAADRSGIRLAAWSAP